MPRKRSMPSAGISRPSSDRRRPGRPPRCRPVRRQAAPLAVERSVGRGAPRLARSTTSTPSEASWCGWRSELWPGLHPGGDDAGRRRTRSCARRGWRSLARHPGPDGLLDFCRRETAAIEAFVRETGLVGLPDAPLRITWTPEFLRPFGGAFLSPPGPLDRGLLSEEFWVTPPDPSWPAERLESYLREENDRMLRSSASTRRWATTCSWTGRDRTPSLARAVFRVRDVRRGLGRLRDPGHDGRGLRQPMTRRCCWRVGSTTCAASPSTLTEHRHPRRRHG